jgi:hypothetical protein
MWQQDIFYSKDEINIYISITLVGKTKNYYIEHNKNVMQTSNVLPFLTIKHIPSRKEHPQNIM